MRTSPLTHRVTVCLALAVAGLVALVLRPRLSGWTMPVERDFVLLFVVCPLYACVPTGTGYPFEADMASVYPRRSRYPHRVRFQAQTPVALFASYLPQSSIGLNQRPYSPDRVRIPVGPSRTFAVPPRGVRLLARASCPVLNDPGLFLAQCHWNPTQRCPLGCRRQS